jgi:hypothetical protein
MTYRIEKDEEGNEALYMNATVSNNMVELDWVHVEDDEQSYAQRGLARIKTIANTDTSTFPPESAFLALRLYRRGDVMISGISCADEYRERAIQLAKEAALGIYDEVYPDVAVKAQAFVQESIENVKRLGAVDLRPFLEANEENQVAADQFLPQLLEQSKIDLEKSGEVVQRIGWLVDNVMALLPGAAPFEKYRYFRAVAEVARRVNADAVVCVSDGYQLDPAGERTGEEVLLVSWINPDATCVSMAAVYSRRKHPQVDHDIITFSVKETLDAAPHEGKQNLIPAWGIYRTN